MCKKQPLISIIIPVYNVEKYVGRCIESVINQTYKNLEIVIINDCSTDKSLTICEQYQKEDKRIKLVSNSVNMGLSDTRNVGFEYSTGDFYMFIDSDDFISKIMIENMVKEAINNEADLITCNFQYYYGKEMDDCKLDYLISVFSNEEAFARMLSNKTNYRAVWAKLVDKKLLRDLRFPKYNRFGEDMPFTPQLIIKARKIIHINEPYYYYNQEGNSIVRSKFNRNRLYMIDQTQKWMNICIDNFPRLYKKAEALYLSTIINMCTLILEKEYMDIYLELKKKIKKKIKTILLSKELEMVDKIKAIIISLFSQKSYYYIRIFLKKDINKK